MGKNKDRLLTKSIPWADSILEQVINLPAAGGEDLQSTAEAQTLVVENLLKMVNRKVAENRGEGQYVWKKSEYAGFSVETTGKQPITLKVTSELGDLSKVDISFFADWVFSLPAPASIKIKGDGTCEYVNAAGTTAYSCSYNPSTQTLTINNNITSSSTWKLSSYKVDYALVVSDDATAYPDGGIKDGYYYEPFEEGIDFSKTAVKKIAVDKFTLAADTAGSSGIKINHSLGELPRAAVIIGEITKCATTNTKYFNVHTCVMINLSNKHGAQVSIGYNYQNTENRVALVSDSAWSNPSETQVQYYDGSSYTILPAGIEFTLITMA